MARGSRRILIVGCGFPQLGLLRFCRSEALFVVGLDGNAGAVGVQLVDDFVHASTRDADAIAAAALRFAVDGLTTCGSEAALYSTAAAAARLGLPFYGLPAALEACRSKRRMREAFARGGAPSPAFRVARSASEARDFAAEFGLPIVIKPSTGWGQRGVSVIMEPHELESRARAALDAACALSEREEPSFLLEQFVPGREFSVNAYTRAGKTEVLAITERIITGYPDPPGITFAEVFPADVSQAEEDALKRATIAGIRALGIRRGPTYTQLRANDEGAFLIETAHRLGGGLDPDVTLLASGVSLYRRIVGVALGDDGWEERGPEAFAHPAAIGRFLIASPGRVRNIAGLAEARAAYGVIDAAVYVAPGDRVYPLTDGSKRAGHVLAVGESRQDAEANAARALGLIHVETEPL